MVIIIIFFFISSVSGVKLFLTSLFSNLIAVFKRASTP